MTQSFSCGFSFGLLFWCIHRKLIKYRQGNHTLMASPYRLTNFCIFVFIFYVFLKWFQCSVLKLNIHERQCPKLVFLVRLLFINFQIFNGQKCPSSQLLSIQIEGLTQFLLNDTCIRIVLNNIHLIIWSCVSNVNSLFQLLSFPNTHCFFINFLSWIFFLDFMDHIFQYLLILFQLIVWFWTRLILTLVGLDWFKMLAHYIMSLSELRWRIQILDIQCTNPNIINLSRLSRLYITSR